MIPAADNDRFAQLQARLAPLFRDVFADPRAPRTVVVIPGLSMDQEIISHVQGLSHYEERQLTLLMLLRLPNTRIVFVTSTPIDPVIVDYYLSLLPGIPHQQAQRRLTMLSAYHGSAITLTRKILDRPRLIARIRAAIGDTASAHMSCFNATEDEKQLALQLDIPLYACDPALSWLGGKSGSRAMFRAAGIELPPGSEDLCDANDIIAALTKLRTDNPTLSRAAVKLNDGASGEGNSAFRFDGAPDAASAGTDALQRWIRDALPSKLAFEADGENWEHYLHKFSTMRGIVEAWITGSGTCSPSAQQRVTPIGTIEMISTHDQVLGGSTGQKFLGSTFPALPGYRLAIQESTRRVGLELCKRGVLGRYGVDFVSFRQADGTWRNVAIEINVRTGGTTHTFQTLQYLTNGQYDPATGEFRIPNGECRCYYATDNLQAAALKRLIPEDLIDIAVENDLHFDQSSMQGVTFNLIGALAEFGKLGVVSIAATPEDAMQRYRKTVQVLSDVAAS